MNKTPRFTKVSEWIAAGGMTLGLYLVEDYMYETEKAIAVRAMQFNRAGNPYLGKAFLPKSQIQIVENDFYTQGAARMFLVPGWLVKQSNLV